MAAIEDRSGGARTGNPGSLGTLGRYQLLEPIASGGMGAIYLARLVGEGGFEKLVALKVLLPEISENARFISMFLDEARIAARLSHRNLCEVYELGSADGRHFIAMQYLRGVPLTDLLRTHPSDRAQHIRVVASLIAQACEGLEHAHEVRDGEGRPLLVVHRDISPPNLFVTVEGVLKILDFGIARARDIDTARSDVKGRQAYMSPEQLVGHGLDRRSDLFSLGVVLYEGVTGTRLFSRETDFLVAKAILEERIDDPQTRRPEVSKALAEVTTRALARSPADRYANARDFGMALSAALGPAGPMRPAEIAAYVQEQFGARLATAEAQLKRATGKHGNRSSRRAAAPGSKSSKPKRLWLALLVVAAMLAAAAVAFVIGQSGSGERSQSGTSDDTTAIGATAGDSARDDDAPSNTDGKSGSDLDTALDPGDPDGAPPTEVATANPLDAGAPDAADRRRGMISIDSRPYATIYVDGRRIGVTPIIGYKVRPGRRRIKAVTASGETRRFTMRVRPGKRARAKRLTW